MNKTSTHGFNRSQANKSGFPSRDRGMLAHLNQDSSHFLPVLERFDKFNFGIGSTQDYRQSPSQTIDHARATTSKNFFKQANRSKLLNQSMSIDTKEDVDDDVSARQVSQLALQGRVPALRSKNPIDQTRNSLEVPNKDLMAVRSRMSLATVGPAHKIIKSRRRMDINANLITSPTNKNAIRVSSGLENAGILAHLAPDSQPKARIHGGTFGGKQKFATSAHSRQTLARNSHTAMNFGKALSPKNYDE